VYKNQAARRPLNAITDQNLREGGSMEEKRERERKRKRGIDENVCVLGGGDCLDKAHVKISLSYIYKGYTINFYVPNVNVVRRREREIGPVFHSQWLQGADRCRLDPCSYQLQDDPPAHTD
jgi:hypothetical protein